MNRTQRQAIIKKIVTENEVSTQNELLTQVSHTKFGR
ncbi:hypothetical protein [Tetragenococcus halophilus]|nr:hypothetical protein [Tetragenococcus halophilus]